LAAALLATSCGGSTAGPVVLAPPELIASVDPGDGAELSAPAPSSSGARCPPVAVDGVLASSADANTVAPLLDARNASLAEGDPCIQRLVDLARAYATVDIDTPLGPYRVRLAVRFREHHGPDGPSERWDVHRVTGAVREARRAIEEWTWLRDHPDFLSVNDTNVGYGVSVRHVRSTTGSTLCVSRDGNTWCWSPGATVDDLVAHARGADEHGVEIDLTLAGDRAERWLYRFPEPQVARGPATVWRARPVQPSWAQPLYPSDASPARAGQAARWSALPAVAPPDLGPLESRTTRVGATDAVEIRAAGDDDVADDESVPAVLLCARVDARWRCAAPRPGFIDSDGSEHNVHFELFPIDASRDQLALAYHETLGNGCCGDGSGAEGYWRADLYAVRSDRLERLGALRLGGTQWVTRRQRERGGAYTTYLGNFAALQPLGSDCFAIGAPSELHHVWGREGSLPADRHDRPREQMPVLQLADEIALDGDGDGVPAGIAWPVPTAERWEELFAPALDWRGVWRVEGSRLVRIARDTSAGCGPM
jgi:hypothetical protein